MKRLMLIATLLLAAFTASADHVKVRLYSTTSISTLNISFDLGSYNLYGISTKGGEIQLLEDMVSEGRSVVVYTEGNQLHVSVNEDDLGLFHSLRLEATDTACILCLNPVGNDANSLGAKQRTYEGDLEVSALPDGSLLIVNDVEFETYIAGVTQSEIYGHHSDIFRIQAIISRTWALRNINKHASDGYNFCDQVHCQAYLNRCIRPDIMMGTIQSSGETLVDSTGALIETPFHSNSGGQTANSEDVWRAALPYLRSVPDTFSFHMRQSDWTRTIPMDRWLNYFSRTHKLNTSDSTVRDSLLHFTQESRCARLLGVPLTRVRSDMQLKSTFFSVTPDSASGNVILHGHGYGHGVGLSQEGAIRMVSLGYSYDSILLHYYTGAVIHHDPAANHSYVEHYADRLAHIIDEDSRKQTQVRSKKDDWLGRLFRLRDREEREEIYIEAEQDNEQDWQYEW